MWAYCPPDKWFGRQRTDISKEARPARPLFAEGNLGFPNYGRAFTDVTILHDPHARMTFADNSHYGRVCTDVTLKPRGNPSRLMRGTANDPQGHPSRRAHCHGRKRTDLTKFTIFSYEDENRLIGSDNIRVSYPNDLFERIDRSCLFPKCPVGQRQNYDHRGKQWSNFGARNQTRPSR